MDRYRPVTLSLSRLQCGQSSYCVKSTLAMPVTMMTGWGRMMIRMTKMTILTVTSWDQPSPCTPGCGGDTEYQSRDMIGCRPDIPADWWLVCPRTTAAITDHDNKNTPTSIPGPPSICRNNACMDHSLLKSLERTWKQYKHETYQA